MLFHLAFVNLSESKWQLPAMLVFCHDLLGYLEHRYSDCFLVASSLLSVLVQKENTCDSLPLISKCNHKPWQHQLIFRVFSKIFICCGLSWQRLLVNLQQNFLRLFQCFQLFSPKLLFSLLFFFYSLVPFFNTAVQIMQIPRTVGAI